MFQLLADFFRALFADSGTVDEEPHLSEVSEGDQIFARNWEGATRPSTIPAAPKTKPEVESELPIGVAGDGSIVFERTDEDEEPEPEPEVAKVGAWMGLSSILNPARTVKFAKSIGLTRADIIINDHSDWRESREFTVRDMTKILTLARVLDEAGIEVHLMSWIMPYEGYIDGAAELLVPMMNDNPFLKSIQWDAEEPWTRAIKPMPYQAAVDRIEKGFTTMNAEMGANGIGYTPSSKFGPFAEMCDYVVPQCYSTSTSGLNPATVVPRLVRRWNAVFGRTPSVIGLASYRQTKIPGYNTDAALRTAFYGALGLEGKQDVIYWSLPAIRRSMSVTRSVRALTKQVLDEGLA